MIYSMTGFGRGTVSRNGRTLTVELKTVNNRFLDVLMKLPRPINVCEEALRNVLKERLSRGRVEVFASYDNSDESRVTVRVNEALVKAYIEAAVDIRNRVGASCELFTPGELLRMPDVVTVVENSEDESELNALITEATNLAVDALLAMRAREGEALRRDIEARSAAIAEMVDRIDGRREAVLSEYRDKLRRRITELLGAAELEEQRFAQEVAYYADHSDITEEITRLRSHFSQLHLLFEEGGAIGRRLDFLVQEMNREVNTIGSKSQDTVLAQLVVAIKAELEKIREQLQNIE